MKINMRLIKYFAFLISLAGLFLLIMNLYGGIYITYSGDDFQLKHLADTGFINYLHTFLTKLNGRFSYALLSYIVYLLPEIFLRLTPVCFEILFIVGLFVLAKRVFPKGRYWILFSISIIITFCLIAISTNTYQTIFWLPSYLAYGFPLGLVLLMIAYWIGLIGKIVTNRNLVFLFLAALFIGGFQEIIALLGVVLVMTTLCIITLNELLLGHHFTRKEVVSKAKLILAPSLGFTLSVVINYLLPATAFRKKMSDFVPERKTEIIRLSWNYSIHLFHSTINQPVVAFCLLFSILAGLIIYNGFVRKTALPKFHPTIVYLSLFVSVLLPFCFLLVTAVITRFGQGLYPPDRELVPFYFCLTLSVAFAGLLLAHLCLGLSSQSVMATAFSLAIIIALLTPMVFRDRYTNIAALNQSLSIQKREAAQRDESIKRQIQEGSRDIHIPFFMTVGDTPYPKADKNYWFNYQMALYYHVDTFSADLPPTTQLLGR